MKFAVLSDIHSNLEALNTVVSEIKSRKIDQVVCLGDVVGYGANPKECLESVRDLCAIQILGNHDQAIFDDAILSFFNVTAKKAILWARSQLTESHLKDLKKFKTIHIDEGMDVTWAHSSIHEPESYHYLHGGAEAGLSLDHLKTKCGFFGHTHIPTLFTSSAQSPLYVNEGIHELSKTGKSLINPGSVGQPRDGNPKLSFAIWDSEAGTVEIIRLSYDNYAAAEKIRSAGLPSSLADRLL